MTPAERYKQLGYRWDYPEVDKRYFGTWQKDARKRWVWRGKKVTLECKYIRQSL